MPRGVVERDGRSDTIFTTLITLIREGGVAGAGLFLALEYRGREILWQGSSQRKDEAPGAGGVSLLRGDTSSESKRCMENGREPKMCIGLGHYTPPNWSFTPK